MGTEMTTKKRKICIVLGSRANYASIKSAMEAIQKHPKLELSVVVGASALLDRYGSMVNIVESDGFTPAARVYMLIEGETPLTMAKSTGLGLLELPTIFDQIKPDVVLTVGDRFETMSTTLAAAYMNIPLAHTMGGEVSGTIDESIRHAVTKFAHIHFPASAQAKERIIRMGESPETVHLVGCPRIDMVDRILKKGDVVGQELFKAGVGGTFDLKQPFLLVSQHPVTTEYGDGERQMTETLMALKEVDMPVLMLWPNADAGSDDTARAMRKFREHSDDKKFHFFKNLSFEIYIQLMNQCAALVGNSSSGIREAAFTGTPVVNIGTRQHNRERADNVIDAPHDRKKIADAIRSQVKHGPFKRSAVYGDGKAGERIAEILSTCQVTIQKVMSY
jgi:UDP-hydrolysing UDP-N-acetyl-D-glucosamine 2-epimerase